MNIKTTKTTRRGVYMARRDEKDVIIINITGTSKPLYEFAPDVRSDGTPVIAIYQYMIDGGKSRQLTITTAAIKSVIGWLPIVINCAERLAKAKKNQT